jgi:hypothetical protein
MANIIEAEKNVNALVEGFEPMIRNIMAAQKKEVQIYITEQLYSGINGNDKPLRPTYLNDPYFKSRESGKWYKNARGYMMWKEGITPPYASSWLGIPRRSLDTPNLIIRGDFHNSITAVPFDKGLRIESVGVSFSDDIERKYGQAIYRVGSYARRYFIEKYVKKGIEDYFRKFGVE